MTKTYTETQLDNLAYRFKDALNAEMPGNDIDPTDLNMTLEAFLLASGFTEDRSPAPPAPVTSLLTWTPAAVGCYWDAGVPYRHLSRRRRQRLSVIAQP